MNRNLLKHLLFYVIKCVFISVFVFQLPAFAQWTLASYLGYLAPGFPFLSLLNGFEFGLFFGLTSFLIIFTYRNYFNRRFTFFSCSVGSVLASVPLFWLFVKDFEVISTTTRLNQVVLVSAYLMLLLFAAACTARLASRYIRSISNEN